MTQRKGGRVTPKGGGASKPGAKAASKKAPVKRGHEVALVGSGSRAASVEFTPKELIVHAPVQSSSPLTINRADVASVVDLRVPGANRNGLVGSRPLRRPPAIGGLLSGGGKSPLSVALVFRTPVEVARPMARRLGLTVPKGEQPTLDVLELAPQDPDELLEALAGARIETAPSVAVALQAPIGIIDDPDRAAEVSAEREKAVRRNGLMTLGALAVPIVVLAIAAILAPSEARGQLIVLLLVWVGIGIALGTSMKRTNEKALERLGSPEDDG